jgi:hypothetical protein
MINDSYIFDKTSLSRLQLPLFVLPVLFLVALCIFSAFPDPRTEISGVLVLLVVAAIVRVPLCVHFLF